MSDWITDANGNRASIAYWGSEEAARASLANLRGCWNCTNCTGCTGCTRCTRCTGCMDCTHCTGCTGCTDCMGCTGCTDCTRCMGCRDCTRCTDCTWPAVIGPVRSDGYQFVMGASRSIHAGCRVFVSLAEAREHWQRTRGGTPLGDETVRILDWIEAEANARQAAKEAGHG